MAGRWLSSLLMPLRHPRAGFTLLELLIVIFIISLISAGFVRVLVGFGGTTLSLEDETRRLHRLLTLTAQQAILQGNDIGLLVEADGYHFVLPVKDYSLAFEDDDLLQYHQLPQGWRLELQQDGQVIPPVEVAINKEATEKETKQPAPSIIFYGSGEITPFQLRIYAIDHPEPTVVEAKENGEIEVRFQEPDQ
ncbi:MAG: type II secretion system minor pseudopilin GspH [Candidatus Polarisedimenticolaceae bacterium]|nr:type II secretion system minor pseudopilin GspH [Candidatus Polarisedimenticolaceae bacterium]